ncbi:MAG: NDP-sugar synthase, partial [Kiritimatiellaceae bacterium]|nr:NDP-sugar synthase [Kiritimatiellaceae bacterium]
MKALFYTGGRVEWALALGSHPWCLLSLGGKPLIEYWLEWAVDLGISDVRVVLGDGAHEVEAFCGDGSRWGVRISYGFLKEGADPISFARRSPEQWEQGLLYIAGAVFPRRLLPRGEEDHPRQAPLLPEDGSACVLPSAGGMACFLSRSSETVRLFLEGTLPSRTADWTGVEVDPLMLDGIKSYYDLNMKLVRGDISRYVPPGFGGGDNAYIGSNVMVPPSVELRPPLIIGNDCRIHPMAVIGPDVVIGNGVIIDRQTPEVSGSVVMDDTYLGRNLEIKDRIVSGTRLVLPEDGAVVDIEDPWLLANLQVQTPLVDAVSVALGWGIALALICVQIVPFTILYLLLRMSGGGMFVLSQRRVAHDRSFRLPFWSSGDRCKALNRIFTGLSLDIFLLLGLVVAGKIRLCGHVPLHPDHDAAPLKRLRRYYPAAIHYESLRADPESTSFVTEANAFYYERYRGICED